jgi:hypothetical protein
MRRAIAVLLALFALAAAGCGGDEEPASDAAEQLDTPPLTAPGGDASDLQETAPTGTGTTPAPAAPGDPGTGGTPPPAGGGTPAPDSPVYDTPPAPGTPPAQFEDFCNENPGACE